MTRNNKKIERLSKGLTGIAGEYFVAGELSRLGFMASVTLRNNDSIDIHASCDNGQKLIAIQVKTNQSGKKVWPVGSKAEFLRADNLFYVFVAFKEIDKRPDYHIVPSHIVASSIKSHHEKWLATPGKNGRPHVDSPIRNFRDLNNEFKDRWDLLN